MTNPNECRFVEAIGDISIEWCETHKRGEVDCVKEKLKVEEARRHGFQLMVKHIALLVEDPHPLKYDRAGGDCVCGKCGLVYLDHPKGPEDFLTLICDGSLVKL